MVDLAGPRLDAADRELLAAPAVGGVILFSRNYRAPSQLRDLCDAIHALRDPPLLVAVDQEGGRVQRFREGFTRLPTARLIGRRYDRDAADGCRLAGECGWLMAAELRAAGVDLSFAPVVDLDRGVAAVIGDRAFHRDAAAVAALAAAYAAGMRGAGMAVTAKHFPGHGAVAADSHLTLPRDERTPAAMADDLAPYRRLIDGGLEAVMMALVAYPAVDERPASFSGRWVRERLRGRLGFRGAVFSDDLSMGGAAGAGDAPARATAALEAGCDMVIVCNDRPAAEAVVQATGAAPAQSVARLAALAGRGEPEAAALRGGSRWREAVAVIERCSEAGPMYG